MKNVALIITAMLVLYACKSACMVIDIADTACATIEYKDPDGTKRSVQMNREELVGAARMTAAKRDGGVWDGSLP